MKIKRHGVRITEIPGLEYIHIEQVTDDRLVKVVLGFHDHPAIGCSIAELGQLLEALQTAHTEARVMQGLPEPQRHPRVFRRGDQIPDDVTELKDTDGDEWVRSEQDGALWSSPALGKHYSNWPARTMLTFAPLTEVLP